MLRKETLKKTLLNAADALDSGNSDYTDSEMSEIIDTINGIVNTKNKLSKEQACKYINKSRATFDNYVREANYLKARKNLALKNFSEI